MKKMRIDEVCLVNPRQSVNLPENSKISFVPMAAVSVNGQVDSCDTLELKKAKNYTVFQNGDVLFAKITPCMENGKGAIVRNLLNGYGAGSTEFIVLRPKENVITAKWLYLYLSQRSFRWECQQHMTGSAGQKRVPPKYLASCEMPVPSIEEQERIVSKIEELFSRLDASVAELKTAKEKLKVYRQAVLKEAFRCAESFVPFGNITDARLGKMLDKEKNTGTPQRYLRNINVRWFNFDLSDLLEMRIGLDEIEKYSIQYGDLVICEGGEPGRCAVWEEQEPIFYQKALHRVRFTDGSNPKFYMYYLWFAAQTGQLKRFFTGTGIKHLTGQSLVKVPVPSADKNTQDHAVSEIEFRLSVCDSIEQTVDTSLQKAEALRQSILKQAFEGRLN